MSVLKKIHTFKNIAQNMGWRYVGFRSWFELSKKTGMLKSKFPTNPAFRQYISLDEWKKTPAQFFFNSRETISFPKKPTTVLKEKVNRLKKGELAFFNAEYKALGKNYDWITNPDSGFVYDINKHWLDINDFSTDAGDIKFVWEKSRFSYLNTIIRYDYHFEVDCSEWVFAEIDSWIAANPINQGPNYKCSQEISLRILNWMFTLYYYKNTKALTAERFARILHTIYWQLHHVIQNINFSRIAVRNNHAITETMMLYLAGIFFPFFPNTKEWSEKGLNWLEEEVAYQVYEDGTFLQFSHNYHRVLVQLLTCTLVLSELNKRKLSPIFHARAEKTLEYLYQCQIEENGQLPNYGANDGALFFPLSDCDYRDYRPQLNALAYYFKRSDLYQAGDWIEERQWLTGLLQATKEKAKNYTQKTVASFPKGGYFIHRDKESLTFIRCGKHKDRPSHADNLHLDIWYKGKNYIRDAGTYKYNTDQETLNYFMGTKGHNTVMLGKNDQMERGTRFIWLNWSNSISASLKQIKETTVFEGSIAAFQQIDKSIVHQRTWQKKKAEAEWVIFDKVSHQTTFNINQVWNLHPDFFQIFTITAVDEHGKSIEYKKVSHYYSSEYGVKAVAPAIIFSTSGKSIQTVIKLK